MVRDELERLLDEVLSDDPRRALGAYRALAEDELPWLEQRAVALARREGLSWALIGRLLGRSRQSVHERFASMVPTVAPRRPESWFDRTLRAQEEAVAAVRCAGQRPGAHDVREDSVAW